MRDQILSSERRAQSILEAWQRLDLGSLEAELTLAGYDCAEADAATSGEQERMELLGVIALRVLQGLPNLRDARDPDPSLETCFRLLDHLVKTGSRAPD